TRLRRVRFAAALADQAGFDVRSAHIPAPAAPLHPCDRVAGTADPTPGSASPPAGTGVSGTRPWQNRNRPPGGEPHHGADRASWRDSATALAYSGRQSHAAATHRLSTWQVSLLRTRL